MEEEPYNLELCLAIGGGLMPTEKLDDDCEEEEEEEKRSTREDEPHKKLRCVVSEEESGNVNEGVRKKLKLDMEQLTLLEDTFRAHSHSMLSLRKKEELAKKLNLRTRQVEVWFQNRRARTKMEEKRKDGEMLRKCCERLSSENQRLKMELQEMKSFNLNFPQCLSCEIIFKTSSSSMGNEI